MLQLLYNLGFTYEKLGDFPRALKVFKESFRAQPRNFHAAVKIAFLSKESGDNEDTVSYLQVPSASCHVSSVADW